WRTGNAGSANFFPEGSLKTSPYVDRRSTLSRPTLIGPPLPGAETMMGVWVTRVGDLVILTNAVGPPASRRQGARCWPPARTGTTADKLSFGRPSVARGALCT